YLQCEAFLLWRHRVNQRRSQNVAPPNCNQFAFEDTRFREHTVIAVLCDDLPPGFRSQIARGGGLNLSRHGTPQLRYETSDRRERFFDQQGGRPKACVGAGSAATSL